MHAVALARATATEGASHGTLRSLLSLDWRSQSPHTSFRTAKLSGATAAST